MQDSERGLNSSADGGRVHLSRREQMLRYLLKHPEYDEPWTNGELTFFMALQANTGKSIVTARFQANPEIFP
jgi:hypothetical protein